MGYDKDDLSRRAAVENRLLSELNVGGRVQ